MSARITGTVSRVYDGSQVVQVRRASGVTTLVIRGPMPRIGQRVTLERESDRGWRVANVDLFEQVERIMGPDAAIDVVGMMHELRDDER